MPNRNNLILMDTFSRNWINIDQIFMKNFLLTDSFAADTCYSLRVRKNQANFVPENYLYMLEILVT